MCSICFVLFAHQEAFDYIGSGRMVYDLTNSQMNFTIDDIKMFVEIGQVGLHGDENIFLHSRGSGVSFSFLSFFKFFGLCSSVC